MNIHVNRIPQEGLQDTATYDPNALDMAREDIHPGVFEVHAFITKTDKELVVKVQIRCPLTLLCGRCLDQFTSTLQLSALFSYAAAPGDTVDITEDVRQEILLAYPLIPRCSPQCKGLCPVCGASWNRDECSHYAERSSSGAPRDTEKED